MSALVIETLLKSSLLIGLAAAINLCLRRRGSAALRHLVWTFAIAGLLALPLFLVGLPRWDVNVPIAPPAISQTEPRALDNVAIPRTSLLFQAGPEASKPIREADARIDRVVVSMAAVLAGLYAIGVVLLLVRLGR